MLIEITEQIIDEEAFTKALQIFVRNWTEKERQNILNQLDNLHGN